MLCSAILSFDGLATYTFKWILWWRFRKAIHRPGGWGGTDRLGALYEYRVIRPEPAYFPVTLFVSNPERALIEVDAAAEGAPLP
jgi:hypothetical protein